MAADDVWGAMAEHKLCPADRIESLKERFTALEAEGEAPALVQWLAGEGAITPYQAAVLEGSADQPLRVGPYVITECIQAARLRGLYRARHQDLEVPLCLKLLYLTGTPAESQASLEFFQREARVAVQADHSNVVRTYQVGYADGAYFIAFENLAGQSLMELLDANSALAEGTYEYADKLWDAARSQTRPEEVCRLIREAALGLAHLHEQGIVHRDVSPQNLWVTSDAHVKIMDFGLARDALSYLDAPSTDEVATGPTEFLGSTDYLSPEQAIDSTEATPASDVYSLGCTLYHALTGRVPFTAASPAKQMILHALRTPTPPSELNDAVYPQLDEVVTGMMAKDPSQRYQSGAQVADALEPFLDPDESLPYEEVKSPQLLDFLRWINEEARVYSPSPPK
jgi:serine/threonine protein kinase